MLVYIITIVITLLLAKLTSRWLYPDKNSTVNNGYDNFLYREYKSFKYFVIIVIIALLPVIISAIRYDVGTDYLGTYTIDYNLIRNGYRTRNEPLSYLVYKISILLSDDIQCFFVISSILASGLAFFAIYRLAVNPVYSIALYFFTYQYFTSMNGIRQMIAQVVVFLGLHFLLRKKYIVFCVFVVIGGLFHWSAFLYISFIFLYLIKLNFAKAICALVIVAVLLNLLKNQIYSLIALTPYLFYLENDVETEVSLLFAIVNILLFLVMGMYYNKTNPRYNLLMNIQMVMVLLCIIQGIVPLVGRVLQLFSFYRILIIPEVSANIKDKRIRLIFDALNIAFYVAYCFYGAYIKNWDDILPYKTFLGY